MIRIFLCGEGPHDIGRIDLSSGDEQSVVDGWIQAFVRRFVGGQLSFYIRPHTQFITFPKESNKFRPFPKGHGRLALLSKLVAVQEGHDVVIFMADADTTNVRKWREKYEHIRDGFGRINNSSVAIVCLPMSASESWLLADAKAWRALGLGDESVLPRRPEEIWGNRHDPEGNHPHILFAQVCEKASVNDDRSTRVEIAKNSSLTVLDTKCPISFSPFRIQLDNLVAALAARGRP